MSSTATEKLTSATAARRPARAEHIGSLLRPEKVKRLVEETYEPGHSALLAEERAKDLTALHDAEDEAIREAVRRQLDIGLDVVSDGEFRRFMFTGSFYDAVDGLDCRDRPGPVHQRGGRGRVLHRAPGRAGRAAHDRQPGRARGGVPEEPHRRAVQGDLPGGVDLLVPAGVRPRG